MRFDVLLQAFHHGNVVHGDGNAAMQVLEPLVVNLVEGCWVLESGAPEIRAEVSARTSQRQD